MAEERDTRTAEDLHFMRKALEEARAAYEEGEVPVGAVVVCRGEVIARCHNLTERLTDVTAHAEMQAITAASEHLGGKYLTECTLYVTVEPCLMCAAALGWSQIKRIVYGTPDEKRGFHRYAPNALHPRTELTQCVLGKTAKPLCNASSKRSANLRTKAQAIITPKGCPYRPRLSLVADMGCSPETSSRSPRYFPNAPLWVAFAPGYANVTPSGLFVANVNTDANDRKRRMRSRCGYIQGG